MVFDEDAQRYVGVPLQDPVLVFLGAGSVTGLFGSAPDMRRRINNEIIHHDVAVKTSSCETSHLGVISTTTMSLCVWRGGGAFESTQQVHEWVLRRDTLAVRVYPGMYGVERAPWMVIPRYQPGPKYTSWCVCGPRLHPVQSTTY